MNLLLDIGNTRTKIVISKNNEFIYFLHIQSSNFDLFQNEINKVTSLFNEISDVIVSNVSKENEILNDFLKEIFKNIIFFTQKTYIPIKNLYKTPQTLGKDRLAAVVGAWSLFENENILIFDAGTALTIDFINKKGEYLGGNISPGLSLRYKALNLFTGNLPELIPDSNFEQVIGNTTNSAITAGVQNGIFYECKTYIEKFSAQYENLKVIFTGGDTIFFENKFKKNIFAEENLVLIGLNKILECNRELRIRN